MYFVTNPIRTVVVYTVPIRAGLCRLNSCVESTNERPCSSYHPYHSNSSYRLASSGASGSDPDLQIREIVLPWRSDDDVEEDVPWNRGHHHRDSNDGHSVIHVNIVVVWYHHT